MPFYYLIYLRRFMPFRNGLIYKNRKNKNDLILLYINSYMLFNSTMILWSRDVKLP